MSKLPTITATIVINETNETHHTTFPDVHHFLAAIEYGCGMAEMAFGRRIVPQPPVADNEKLTLVCVFVDTGAPYMTVNAVRNSVD